MREVGAGTMLLRLASAIVGVAALFSLLPGAIHRWGATDEEVAAAMPGDGMLARPLIVWTHGETIRTTPDRVWPWIAQLGDRRGGFYSYTFIENLIARGNVYHNAARIRPELQNPSRGTSLIEDFLSVRAVEPGRSLLAVADAGLGIGWTWIWALRPLPDGSTRLVVRCRIDPTESSSLSPTLGVGGAMIDLGGFVMERKMLQGIRLRAEGEREPEWLPYLEIALWVLLLAEGLAAGLRFIGRRAWWPHLVMLVAAVLLLFLFTFVQPPIWLRVLSVAAVAGGVVWAIRGSGRVRARGPA